MRSISRAKCVAIVGALAGLIYAGVVASPAIAGVPSHFGINGGTNVFNAPSIGYPPPGEIYAPFTDCPLNRPDMQTPAESAGGTQVGCAASISTSGTFSIHGIPVSITHPVIVQFGERETSSGFIAFAPADGRTLVDQPEATPGGLTTLLLCPNGINADIAALCQKATTSGQTGLTALVRSAGPITNFNISTGPPFTSFTQPVKIQLINPLLGGNCYIGTDANPIVLHPGITSGTLTIEFDPNGFADTGVFHIVNAQATDNTFTVPVATGCGPGGVADAAIDFLLGLPSPSGANSLVLNGDSYLASTGGGTDLLKAAFLASGQSPH
jgi:hypothetical protein